MKYESIDWDDKKGRLIITKQEHININDSTNIGDAKIQLKNRLAEIIQQVKGLKVEAERIKLILDKLEEKAGPIDPASDSVESQLSPAE